MKNHWLKPRIEIMWFFDGTSHGTPGPWVQYKYDGEVFALPLIEDIVEECDSYAPNHADQEAVIIRYISEEHPLWTRARENAKAWLRSLVKP